MKVGNFVFIITGILILLNLVGVTLPVSGFLMNSMLSQNNATFVGNTINYSNTNVQASPFGGTPKILVEFGVVLALLLGIGVFASNFITYPPPSYLIAGLIGTFSTAFLIDFFYIGKLFWSYGSPYNIIGTLILFPFVGLYAISVIRWWQGVE